MPPLPRLLASGLAVLALSSPASAGSSAGAPRACVPLSPGPPPPPDTLETVRDSVVRALRPGERVRLDAPTAYHLVGRLRRVEEGTIVLDPERPAAGDTALVAVAHLDRLWTEEPRTGKGALFGAITGGGIGVVMGLVVTSGVCEVSCGDDYVRNVARLAGAGGFVGTGVGAGLGALSTRWALAFPP